MRSRVLENTGPVYGFLVIFLSLLTTHCGDANVVVAFEGGRGYRNEMYPNYKKSRPKAPIDIKQAIPFVKKLIRLLGLALIEVKGWEGDDVIGTLVTTARRSGIKNVVVVSDDKDLLQILQEGVTIMKTNKSMAKGFERIGVSDFVEKYEGLRPRQFTDVLALAGDASDNIQGVKGIGMSTAKKLIKEFGSLDSLLETVEREPPEEQTKAKKKKTVKKILSNAIRKLLFEQALEARTCKKLVTISLDVPLDASWNDIKRKPVFRKELELLCTNLAIDIKRQRKRLIYLYRLFKSEEELKAESKEIVKELDVLKKKGLPDKKQIWYGFPKLYNLPPTAFRPSQVMYDINPSCESSMLKARLAEVKAVGIDVAHKCGLSRGRKIKVKDSAQDKQKEASSHYDINNWNHEDVDEQPVESVALAIEKGSAFYIEIPVDRSVPMLLRNVLEDSSIVKYGLGLKSVAKRLKSHHDCTLRGRLCDADICSTLFHFGHAPRLSDSVDLLLGQGATDFFIPKESNEASIDESLLSVDNHIRKFTKEVRLRFESCGRADLWLQLIPAYVEQMEKRAVLGVLRDIESPLVSVLAEMEMTGVRCVKEVVSSVGKEAKARCEKVRGDIVALTGYEEINLLSNDQVGALLFKSQEEAKALGWKGRPTAKNKFSTNAQTLQDYVKFCDKHLQGRTSKYGEGKKDGDKSRRKRSNADNSTLNLTLDEWKRRSQVAKLVLEYRSISKISSLHVRNLIDSIREDGRIHPHFVQLSSGSGRMSTINPNLQNLPVRSNMGSLLRRSIQAEEGFTILCADYSQIELRILAALSRDENLLAAFDAGTDVHSVVAAMIFKLDSPEDVQSSQRTRAKAVSYGIPYGLSASGLAMGLGISRTEAKELIQKFHTVFPAVEDFTKAVVENAYEKGYAETLTGRKLYLPQLKGAMTERKMGERIAVNMPIQGTQADMIKLAMVKIYNRLQVTNSRSRMILQIHDELVFEVAEEEREEVHQLVVEEMSNSLSLPGNVEVVVQTAFGPSWLDAAPH